MLCDEQSSGVMHRCLCSPMSNIVAMLYQETSSVLLSCGEPQACDKTSIRRSKILPCGTFSYFKEGKVRMSHYISAPSSHIINITLWRLESRRIPYHEQACRYVQNLTLKDDVSGSLPRKALDLKLCGTAWRQNILSSTCRINIIWESTLAYPEKSGFCLTYQPLAAGYATMIEYHNNDESVGNTILMTTDKNNPLLSTGFPDFFIKFSRGQRTTYTLSYTGGVLEAPRLEIHKFRCLTDKDEPQIDSGAASLAVYDWPTFLFDTRLQTKRSLISEIPCSDGALAVEFNSTNGDLSIVIQVPQDIHVSFNGTLSHVPLPCPEQFCHLSMYTVPHNSSIKFVLSSRTGRLQQRVILSTKENNPGNIFVSNLTVGFRGFTHFPCTFGGIFIYEISNGLTEVTFNSNSLSLLAKICSPWMAQIWNRGMEYSREKLGLHFNVRPLLFVIKTYDHYSSSHIEGHASLSNCAGVVNFLFDPTPREYEIPNSGLLIMHQQINIAYYPLAKHTNGCLVIQHLLWGNNYNTELPKSSMPMNFTSVMNTQLPEHTIGSSFNDSFLPFDKSSIPCYLHAYPVGIGLNNLRTIRPLRFGYDLLFEYECLLRGERPFVIMKYTKEEISAECLTSENTEKLLLADEEESIHYVPIAICATIDLNGNMYVRDYFRKVILIFNKPHTIPVCCVLKMNINMKLRFLENIIWLKTFENYQPYTQGIPIWWKLWKPIHSSFDNSLSEAVSGKNVHLLGDGVALGSLFGNVILVVDLKRAVSSFRPTTSIMDILFNYTYWQRNMNTGIVRKSETTPGVNYFCTEETQSCYTLIKRDQTSWKHAQKMCEKLGLTLLSASSDFEWKQFEELVAHHKIWHDQEVVVLSFLNLRYRQASF